MTVCERLRRVRSYGGLFWRGLRCVDSLAGLAVAFRNREDSGCRPLSRVVLNRPQVFW